MSIQGKIPSVVASIRLADRHAHALNSRGVIDAAGLVSLAKNIRALRLIQNLAGLRAAEGRVGIVAGGRRLRALEMLRGDPRFETVPVRISPDVETARLWASTQYHLREALHPADEIREYAALAERITTPEIAIAFGVSDAQVKRCLKRAALPAAVLDALRANEISLAAAACFTICEDLPHALAVLEQVHARALDETGCAIS